MKYCPLAFGTLQECLKNDCALYIDTGTCWEGQCALRAVGVSCLDRVFNKYSLIMRANIFDYAFPKERKQEKESVASNE